jgi:hypothetical protein
MSDIFDDTIIMASLGTNVQCLWTHGWAALPSSKQILFNSSMGGVAHFDDSVSSLASLHFILCWADPSGKCLPQEEN